MLDKTLILCANDPRILGALVLFLLLFLNILSGFIDWLLGLGEKVSSYIEETVRYVTTRWYIYDCTKAQLLLNVGMCLYALVYGASWGLFIHLYRVSMGDSFLNVPILGDQFNTFFLEWFPFLKYLIYMVSNTFLCVSIYVINLREDISFKFQIVDYSLFVFFNSVYLAFLDMTNVIDSSFILIVYSFFMDSYDEWAYCLLELMENPSYRTLVIQVISLLDMPIIHSGILTLICMLSIILLTWFHIFFWGFISEVLRPTINFYYNDNLRITNGLYLGPVIQPEQRHVHFSRRTFVTFEDYDPNKPEDTFPD